MGCGTLHTQADRLCPVRAAHDGSARCHASKPPQRSPSLRLGLVCGPRYGPALALAPVQAPCSRLLRASASYGERFSVHVSVRITPWHERNRRYSKPVSSLRGDIRHARISQPPDYGHTPRKLPRFRAISRIIADCAPNRRFNIITKCLYPVNHFFTYFLTFFHACLAFYL